MRIATIFAYLIGRRWAILEVASDRNALGVGALLVLSAGLARNYDRAALIYEPWRLLGPFVASLAISGPLFVALFGFARRKGMESPGIGRAYLTFLALYWMTSPLAWLYGIPYERFLAPADAVDANLKTLALVSFWRVALIIRAASVIFGVPARVALPIVMLVADSAALVALHLLPVPVIPVMGGVNPELSEIMFTQLIVMAMAWLTLPVWIVLSATIAARPAGVRPEWGVPSEPLRLGSGLGALAFAALAVAGWASALPWTQPEQVLASQVDRAYKTQGPAAALAMMSAHGRREFPPDWQPPPRRFHADPTPSEVLDVLDALAAQQHAEWVDELYTQWFLDRARYDWYMFQNELLDQHAVRLAGILTRLDRGPEMARALRLPPEQWLDQWLARSQDLPGDQRNALETLRRLADQAEKTAPDNSASPPKTQASPAQ